jgi:type IV pilus assembly protein PilE
MRQTKIRNSRSLMRRVSGFTLVEVMVAAGIVAILGMVAFPSFMQSVRKSKRTDAQTALTNTSTMLERFFGTNGTYTTNTAVLGLKIDSGTAYSANGEYVMTVAAGATGIGSSYTVTATAKSGGMQSKDTGCTVLTVNSLGRRTPDPSTTKCW